MARGSRSLATHSLFALLTAGLAQVSAIADTAVVTASATVTVASSGMVQSDLNFGSFYPGPTGGTVTIDPRFTGAARLSYTGVTMANTASISDALFYLTGHPNAYYQIGLPSSTTLTGPAGATMIADTFRSCPIGVMVDGNRVYSTRGRLHSHTIGGGRPTFYDEVYVGATLHVAPAQPTGYYLGAFSVTFTFE